MFDAKLFNEICSHYDIAFSKDHSLAMLLDEQGNAKKIEEEDLTKPARSLPPLSEGSMPSEKH